jgi:uncharacterized protein (TIGR03437 family)
VAHCFRVKRLLYFCFRCLLGLVSAVAYSQELPPDYTQSTILNRATMLPGPLAPNTMATIIGTHLAAATRQVRAIDMRGGFLPTTLVDTGTVVFIGSVRAPIFAASPDRIDFLVPSELVPGPVRLTVAVFGLSGRPVTLHIATGSPGLFALDGQTVAATDAPGRVINAANPARAGEWVSFYGTGLGDCNPLSITGEPVRHATPIAQTLQVWLGSTRVFPAYAGLAPGFAGLYQVNVLLPADLSGDLEVRFELNGYISPRGVTLPIRR